MHVSWQERFWNGGRRDAHNAKRILSIKITGITHSPTIDLKLNLLLDGLVCQWLNTITKIQQESDKKKNNERRLNHKIRTEH